MLRKRKELELPKQRQAVTSHLLLREQAIIVDLLILQVAHDDSLNRLSAVGVELPQDLELNILDLIADWCGVPEDETCKPEAREYHDNTGRYPKDTYCRDWMHNEFEIVQNGDVSPEDFVALLCAASNQEAS